jgi:NTP pyrophosphatase (non-canonical NTP hydrolase)
VTTELKELQKYQLQHDKDHHRDIFTLPYLDRMDHYVLHFSKYVGRLSPGYETSLERRENIEKTLADAFIVVLAAANTLNLDLQEQLETRYGQNVGQVCEWTNALSSESESMSEEDVQDWLFMRLATPAGHMSNVMESFDHMERGLDFKEFDEELIEIAGLILTAAGHIEVSLKDLVEDRWDEIERSSVL